jgi:hypothetical protein
MKRLRPKFTYANVISTLCLFLLLGGASALAAGQLGKNSVGTKQLKNNAVTTKKIKNGAVTGAKLATGAVTGAKLATGAVTGDKLGAGAVSTTTIADGAVSTSKITPGERSEGFSKTTLGGAGVSLTENETTVATLNLPTGGHYLVTATTGIGGNGATLTAAICSLRDNGTEIDVGGGTAAPSGQLSGSVALNGVSNGGTVTLACSQAIVATTISKNQVITAVRVNSVTQ